jgi:hypothetical protein
MMKRNTDSKMLNRIGKTISTGTKTAMSRLKTGAIGGATPSTTEATQKRIEEKAYEIFQRRIACGGSESFDWSLAEDFVKLQLGPKKGRIKSAVSDKEIQNLTAQKAYEIFQRKNSQADNNTFDWIIAEELVRLEQAAKN